EPVLSVQPNSPQIFRGENVTFTCTIPGGSELYHWYKDDIPVHRSDHYVYIIKIDQSHKYRCYGSHGEESTTLSNEVTLSVIERPKAVVTLQPDGQIFNGEKVTFRCEVRGHADTEWMYNWYQNNVQILSCIGNGEYTLTALKSDSGQYTCSGQRKGDSQISERSNAVTLTVPENLNPVVIIRPDNHVFRGETVTFRCEIQGGGDTEWQYSWYKNNSQLYHNTQEFSLNSVIHEDSGQYTCRGLRSSDTQRSQTSDAVTLAVSETAEAVVSVSPQSWLTEGDSVTLNCEIKFSSTGWTFSWYTDVLYRDSHSSLRHRPELLSDSSRGSGGSYTLSPVTLNHTGVYMCRAVRGEEDFYSQYSKEQPLWITGEYPPVSLIINPSRTQHFTADSLSMSCKDHVDSTGWTVRGYTHNERWYECSLASGSTCYISSISLSHTGVYWCQSESGERSNPVNITVHKRPKAVVTLKSDGQIFIGEKVTFTCEIQGHADTEWTYTWYKDDVQILSYSENGKYAFTVLESDSSKYNCSGQRKSDSQTSKTSNAVTLTVSEKPKPKVTSDLKGAALTGNSVTLYCTLKLQSAGWKFYWSKDSQSRETETETHSYTIRSVSVSDGGQYRCRAGRGNPVYYTHYSVAFWINVTENLKPVVIIRPDSHVFRGETVTFRCKIQGGGDTEWQFSWYKNNNPLYHNTQEFSLNSVRHEDSGQYTCRGLRSSDTQRSEINDAVVLTVSETAEAVVSVSPQSWLTEGDSVTLNCEIKSSSTGWTFSWYTDVLYRDSQGSYRYRPELLSDSSRGSGGSYTLSPVTLNHTGVYMCRAVRGEQVFYSQYSKDQPLWITGESPPVSLIINPSRTQHFTADSISLSCENHRDSTGWTVRRYTCNETWFDCLSVSGSTCNISSLSPSHTGVYWCQSESGECSNPVNITVHNGDVILDSPVHPLTEGRPLTLHCLYRNTKISDSGVDFYKDDLIVQNQTAGEMIFSSVSKSDEGFYHCKHPERGESPKSWISVRDAKAPVSVFRLISSLLTVSVYLLLTIILVVK
ncbi:sialoadhesin-like, partial [Silurus asotus]